MYASSEEHGAKITKDSFNLLPKKVLVVFGPCSVAGGVCMGPTLRKMAEKGKKAKMPVELDSVLVRPPYIVLTIGSLFVGGAMA